MIGGIYAVFGEQPSAWGSWFTQAVLLAGTSGAGLDLGRRLFNARTAGSRRRVVCLQPDAAALRSATCSSRRC